MMTLAEAEELFIGPQPASKDWLLPTYLQPTYGSQYIEGGFPAGTFTEQWVEPAPTSWLSTLTKPFASFGESLYKAAEPAVTATYEKLPELLWGWGLERAGVIDKPKKVPVDEGAGVKVTHTQPAHAGGEPAQPISITIPQLMPGFGAEAVPQKKEAGTLLLIGAGLFVLYLLLGKK